MINPNEISFKEEVPVEPQTEPDFILAPTNLYATVNDDVIGVTLNWEYSEENPKIAFKVFLNDQFSGAISSNRQIQLADLIAGETYKATIKAVNTETLLESEFSNEVYFEVKGLIGSDNPANWIGVRLDNITVIYQK